MIKFRRHITIPLQDVQCGY